MKYQIIYCDPPWDYKGQKNFLAKSQHSSAEMHYPTMPLQDMIKEFTPMVQEWADDDCLLYMWTSSPHLDQAISLGTAWGFDYKTIAFVWEKQRKNPGFYTMSSTEMCLVFKKMGGKIPQPRGARNVEQLVVAKAREHSRKPEEVRRRLEKMHPTQNKLEMFARTAPEGWNVFGNQTEKFKEEFNLFTDGTQPNNS